MIINGTVNSKRTKILQEEYLKLLKNGVNTENILVLVQNSKKKNEFINYIKENSSYGSIGNLKIYSFWGLVYNFVLENWAIIENSIKDTENPKISPNLCGLEVSQFMFKECINEVDFTGYNSKTSLLHQLLRRNSLINLNDLSEKEVLERSKILKEAFFPQTKSAIQKYKLKTIQMRAFDYMRQLNLFKYLYKKIKNPFQYVFLDDGDEITPFELEYLKYISPNVKEYYIGYDKNGSSRLGYLGAINVDFEKVFQKKAINLSEKKDETAKTVLKNVRENIPIDLENTKIKTFVKRNEMINSLISDIKELVNEGILLKDIAIITPMSDEFLKNALIKSNLKFNFLSKSEKLNQNKFIGYTLELLKIINFDDYKPCFYMLKGILCELLKMDYKIALQLIQEYKLNSQFESAYFFDFLKSKQDFSNLIQMYEKIRFEKVSFQLYEIFSRFIDLKKENSKDIIKINQLLKQVNDFEEVFKDKVSNKELIIQLENTIISENPLSDDEIDENVIVVSTAQKIIDYSYKSKYLFFLDCSNETWLRQDIGPLYNAWVMQKNWSKNTYEMQDNIQLTLDKTARILYKLFLLGDFITLYSSSYDSLGQENFSGIDKFFKFKNQTETKEIKPITPRQDQKAVLAYKGGLMSVSAAAGSGKTTIMLLLTEKILKKEIFKDIEAKNIFVLTFMESAARNFKERIKAKYPDLELPNILTIHGLALRIIKENNNFAKLNLDYDFEIVDEIKRSSILSDILKSLNIDLKQMDIYDKAISTYKNEIACYPDFTSLNKVFLNVYNMYQEKL
ncbi:UvrD-helicase domain-containing protein, partial [bacterium]|nr:UvrD-helicase domain-containing protein [bacterium]